VTVDKLSNKLPGAGSDTTTDIFASWQVPTDHDNVHNQVRVCKDNGLLADSSIPDALAEVRIYGSVHSEMPNNPNWEGPVQAWAAANNLASAPPTQKCDINSENVQPTVSLTAPNDGATVTGPFIIAADASSPLGVKSVQFFIDSNPVGTATSTPYQVSYDPQNLSPGSHVIQAVVTSNNGTTVASAGLTINVSGRSTTTPSNVSNLTGTAGPGTKKVTLTWTNPTDINVASVKITVSLASTGETVQTASVAKPGASAVIDGLTSGAAYRFTAQVVDTSGNISSGVSVVVTAP
jgi:hypothetical protein